MSKSRSSYKATSQYRSYKNSQMVIITGPNLDLSIKLMKRLKAIFEPKLGIIFQNKETVLELNGCTLESFLSNHLDSFRSLTNPKFILLDESDMFRKSEQEDIRHVSERYIGKSDSFLVDIDHRITRWINGINKERTRRDLYLQKIIP